MISATLREGMDIQSQLAEYDSQAEVPAANLVAAYERVCEIDVHFYADSPEMRSLLERSDIDQSQAISVAACAINILHKHIDGAEVAGRVDPNMMNHLGALEFAWNQLGEDRSTAAKALLHTDPSLEAKLQVCEEAAARSTGEPATSAPHYIAHFKAIGSLTGRIRSALNLANSPALSALADIAKAS